MERAGPKISVTGLQNEQLFYLTLLVGSGWLTCLNEFKIAELPGSHKTGQPWQVASVEHGELQNPCG